MLLLLIGCRAPFQQPSGPLDPPRRWGETVQSYRYDRTTVTYGPDGATVGTVVMEKGEVVLPDRQYVKVSSRTGATEASSEVMIVGQRAWVRLPVVGGRWEEAPPEQRPADPLTIALGTLAVAGPVSNIGERREEDGRRCRGWAYTFEPARAPNWPAVAGKDTLTAEAALWTQEDGAICGQTIRIQRDGRLTSEYSFVLRDIDVELVIEPPAG